MSDMVPLSADTRNPIHDPIAWLLAAVGAICLLGFVRSFLTIGLHLPLNFNEGWNAYHAADVASGRPLYPDPSGQFFTNYPPLSFFVIAPIGRLLGDQMLAGRLVSLVSLAAWIALVAVVARLLRCPWTSAIFGAIVLAVSMFVFSDFYVGVNDPQMLGHAVQLLGVALLLRGRRTIGSLTVAAVLMAAGVFIKNNLIAVPLATAAWLWFTDRGAARRLIVIGAIAGLAGIALCFAAFGPRFAEQVLSPRRILATKAGLMAWEWIRRMLLPLFVAAWLAWRARDREAGFAMAYAAAAIGLGFFFAAGEGVYVNTMFDADCALALTAAMALARIPESSRWRRRLPVPAAYLAAPALTLALGATVHWLSPRFWFDPRWSEAGTAGMDIDFVRHHEGRAFCEDLALCYFAGKPREVDVFNLQQRATREPWRTDALARQIEAHEFSVAETDDPGRDLGPRFSAALQQHYRVDHRSQWGVFWVPR